MPISVKVYRSTDTGAPTLPSTASSLINVLDACLVNGFGSVTLNSLVVSSNVATGTVSTGHGFTLAGSTGPVIRVAGAAPSGLNGDSRIASIPNATTFTFATTGISDQTATGTVTAKRAPAGFAKTYSGTNKAVYRSDDIAGTRIPLQINDSSGNYFTASMYESMTDVDTGTNGVSVGGYKDTSNHWVIVADSIAFYLFVKSAYSDWRSHVYFGDIINYKPSDQYHCALIGCPVGGYTSRLIDLNDLNDSYLCRNYTQFGSAVSMQRRSHTISGSRIGSAGNSYPSAIDDSFHAWPIEVWEASGSRGLMPGMWNPLHSNSGPSQFSVIDGVPQLLGRDLMVCKLDPYGWCAMDITGPWRE